MKYLVPLDLNQNELQNPRMQNLAAAPANPVVGQYYFNTTTNKAMVYNGSSWIPWEGGSGNVTGVKGDAESTYRTGDINITAANVGAVPTGRTINGHPLSSNVTITASDVGLGNVTDGAEVNQKAYSNVKVGTTTIPATSKTDTLNISLGANLSWSADADEKSITVSATDTTYSAGTQAQLESGIDTTNHVWQPKIIHDYIASAAGAIDAMRFKGTIGTGGDVTTLPTSNVKIGDTYRVITAGTYASQVCEIGDLIIAISTTPTWTVAQTNIDGAITSINGTSPVSVTGNGASRTISVSDATTDASGLMSSTDKSKLNGITAGAEPNRTYTVVTSKPTGDITANVNDGYVTISQIGQDATGQITATDRKLYVTADNASISDSGLLTSDGYSRIYYGHATAIIRAGQTSVTWTNETYTSQVIAGFVVYTYQAWLNGNPVAVDCTCNNDGESYTFTISQAVSNDILIQMDLAPDA